MGLDSHLIVTKTRVIANYDVFDSRGVSCNTENHTLNVPDDIWVGPFLSGNTTMIVVHPCLFQYCETGERTITISDGFDSTSDLDEQCSSEQHRGGCCAVIALKATVTFSAAQNVYNVQTIGLC